MKKDKLMKMMAAALMVVLLSAPMSALSEEDLEAVEVVEELETTDQVQEIAEPEQAAQEAPDETAPLEATAEAAEAAEEAEGEAQTTETVEAAEIVEAAEAVETVETLEVVEAVETLEAVETVEAPETVETVEAEPFTGSVRIERQGGGEIRLGDKVVLAVAEADANADYSIHWEVDRGGEWKYACSGDTYRFTVDENTALYAFRAALVAEDGEGRVESNRIELTVTVEPEAAEEAIEENNIPADGTETEAAEATEASDAPAEATGAETEEAAEDALVDIEDYETPMAASDREVTSASRPDVRMEQPLAVDLPVDADAVQTLVEADVRLDADGLSEIFLTLPEGTELNVLGIEGDWVMVDVDGRTGYIYKDDVEGLDFEALLPEAEDEEATDGEISKDPAANMKVTIFSSRRSVMTEGETVTLTSKLEGFDGFEIRYQWECDKGNGFEAVAGANDSSYAFAATQESLRWDWQLSVYYR